MGCTNCTVNGGCDERKRTQREIYHELLARLYPDRTWGRLAASAPGDGIGRGEVRRLRRSLAELLCAPTYFLPGGDEDVCHFVYVLCVGREPALIDIRDGAASFDGSEVGPVSERYLRIAFSTLARLATVQEVEMALEGEPELVVIREAPRAGVYDPVLLGRLRKLTAMLSAADITYCDFGLLDQPVAQALALDDRDAYHAGDYQARYGELPRLCNFLFFAPPPATTSYCFVPRSTDPSALAPPA